MPTATPTVTSTPSPTVTPTPIPTATPTPTVTATPTPLVEITRGSSSRSYYQQSAEIHGVSIKAARGVSPETLQMVARVVNLMLDGRADIRDCIAGNGSEFVVLQKGHTYLDIPDFMGLSPVQISLFGAGEDIWGRQLEDLHGWGAKSTWPTTIVSESALLGETNYRPYDVAIHEFAHSIMNLCFNHATMQKLGKSYRATVEAGHGFGIDIILDRKEFFAEFSSVYFDAHTEIPRRALVEKLPSMLEFLEEIYGELSVHENPNTGFVHYTTQSGIPVPWHATSNESREYPSANVYVDPDLMYSIEIPKGWQLAAIEPDSVLWRHLSGRYVTGSFSIEVLRLPFTNYTVASQIFDEYVGTWQQDFESPQMDWDEFTRRSTEKVEIDGTYWVTSDYHGTKSQDTCPVNIRNQIAVITHLDILHRATLYMSLCTDEPGFEEKWDQLRQSFQIAASDLK